MEKFNTRLAKGLGTVLTILMAVMVLDVSWQVFTRFVLRDPSPFTEELAGFLLIWIGLLGASYAFYTRAHLGIDILTNRLHGTKRRVVEVLIPAIVMSFAIFVLVLGGIHLVNLTLTLQQVSPALGIKMGYVYLVIPVSGILIIFFSIGFIEQAVTKKTVEEEKRRIVALD